MCKPLLVTICQFVFLNHHERRELTPDYDGGGSLEANGLHSEPKKRYKKKIHLVGFFFTVVVKTLVHECCEK
jgi:hypothetical protein